MKFLMIIKIRLIKREQMFLQSKICKIALGIHENAKKGIEEQIEKKPKKEED